MIPFERNRQQTIPNSSVKIIGVGGAGANMLDRVALDGMDGAELLVANSDVRTLASSVSAEKVQLGRDLTKGLGTGGDPDLGRQAANEAELELRDALRDRKIVFICVGLGGGTGSGAAPLIARLAREEGAFTVVFATMPFAFEGRRRREQAGTALNELAVLSNALVTFDNGRMGDLVLAKQGVHEAFAAADRMVSEAIRAVTRIVMRPGLVNIGLDDLVAALSSNRSRCLFGSGIAEGENRAQQALKNALVSPLLDRGSLLSDAQNVLVHICGGEDLTLYEIELLMRGLGKHVPETAQLLFGTAVDPSMGDSLSVTLVSSLPEEKLQTGTSGEPGGKSPRGGGPDDAPDDDDDGDDDGDDADGPEDRGEPDEAPRALGTPAPVRQAPPVKAAEKLTKPVVVTAAQAAPVGEPEPPSRRGRRKKRRGGARPELAEPPKPMTKPETPFAELEPESAVEEEAGKKSEEPALVGGVSDVTRRVKLPPIRPAKVVDEDGAEEEPIGEVFSETEVAEDETVVASIDDSDDWADAEVEMVGVNRDGGEPDPEEDGDVVAFETVEPGGDEPRRKMTPIEDLQAAAEYNPKPQGELLLEGGPKGKFEGEAPNLVEGEDLDIPPFLRRRK